MNEDKLIAKIKIDSKTGIAYVDDGSTGLRYTVHPSIHKTGSVVGMKTNRGWGKNDRIRRFGSFQYNIEFVSYNCNSELECELANRCRCEACLERRSEGC